MNRLKFDTVDLSDVYVDSSNWKCILIGEIQESDLDQLKRDKFDQAPVKAGEKIIGLIDREELERLFSKGLPLRQDNPLIKDRMIPIETSVQELLDALSENSCLLVRSVSQPHRIVGLIQISDLDKPDIRICFYLALLKLEKLLSKLVGSTFSDPWDWIKLLNDDQKVQILGSWELQTRRNVELTNVGPLYSCNLSNLISLAEKNIELRNKLGYQNGKRADEELGCIPDLRNRIMHPVRPLVLGNEDVKNLAKSWSRLISAISRLGALKI